MAFIGWIMVLGVETFWSTVYETYYRIQLPTHVLPLLKRTQKCLLSRNEIPMVCPLRPQNDLGDRKRFALPHLGVELMCI